MKVVGIAIVTGDVIAASRIIGTTVVPIIRLFMIRPTGSFHSGSSRSATSSSRRINPQISLPEAPA